MCIDHVLRGELQLLGKLLLHLTQPLAELLLHLGLLRLKLLLQLLLQLHAAILLAAHGILILPIRPIQMHAGLEQGIVRTLAEAEEILLF